MENYMLLIISAILLAVNMVATKLYENHIGSGMNQGLIFNIWNGLFTGIIFFMLNGFKIHFTIYSLVLASAMSIFSFLYCLIGFKIMRLSNIALYTLFLMSGGMVVPYIWGLLFLNEPFSILRTIALILITVVVAISVDDKIKVDRKVILYCIAVFILNGFVSVISKLHQIETIQNKVNTTEFVMLSGFTKAIICFVLLNTGKFTKVAPTEKTSIFSAIVIIAATALIGGFSYYLQLIGAKTLPASVLYPIITAGSIIFTTLLRWFIFHEKPTKRLTVCIVLCMFGTCMFL